MRKISIVTADPLFMKQENPKRIEFTAEDYEIRLSELRKAMDEEGLSHVLIYGDREHFANVAYFTGFEPRFEETLFILSAQDKRTILVGNENMSYSNIIPFPVERILYQNFSLQGQPREKVKPLDEIFASLGMGKDTKIGIAGYKYFYPECDSDADSMLDIPVYIYNALLKTVTDKNIVNFIRHITSLPDGIRMCIRTAKEIAHAEYYACITTNVMQRLLKGLKPGVSETELSAQAGLDFTPMSVFPMLNFGENIAIGLRSPGERTLSLGEPTGMCYAVRYALTSRVGVAAYNEASYNDDLKGTIEGFFKPFWDAIATWYESVYIGVKGGLVYKKVMDIIGGEKFGVTLNPGHYIGGDEWTNSPFFEGSETPVKYGAHLQCDIIVGSGKPLATGICEDGIVLADETLRNELKAQYPEVWERIEKRREVMSNNLGMTLSPDVLPLSNMCGAYFPFMLDTTKVFSLK